MPDPEVYPTLAARLNKLFDEIRPVDRGGQPYSNAQVAAALIEANRREVVLLGRPKIRVSGAYLSALRTGVKHNPNADLLKAIAKHFGVPTSYFFDDAEQTEAAIALARVAGHYGVRQLALRALELTPQGLAAVIHMVEHVLQADQQAQDTSSAGQHDAGRRPQDDPAPGRETA